MIALDVASFRHPSRPRLRFGLRSLFVATAVVALVFAYAGSYYRLSRRGMSEAREVGLAGFLYMPLDDAERTQDLRRHHVLKLVFLPLNLIDQRLSVRQDPYTVSCGHTLRNRGVIERHEQRERLPVSRLRGNDAWASMRGRPIPP